MTETVAEMRSLSPQGGFAYCGHGADEITRADGSRLAIPHPILLYTLDMKTVSVCWIR